LADQPGQTYDLAPLLAVLERVSFDPARLAQLAGVVRLRDGTLVLRAGRVQAVLTRDPADPDRVVVATVYRADDDQSSASLERQGLPGAG
jgi:hypothetical protein